MKCIYCEWKAAVVLENLHWQISYTSNQMFSAIRRSVSLLFLLNSACVFYTGRLQGHPGILYSISFTRRCTHLQSCVCYELWEMAWQSYRSASIAVSLLINISLLSSSDYYLCGLQCVFYVSSYVQPQICRHHLFSLVCCCWDVLAGFRWHSGLCMVSFGVLFCLSFLV